MNSHLFKKGLVIALSVYALPAVATDIRFDGFASFVMGQTLEDDEGDLYGYDDRFGFQENSLFALQMRADLEDNLSATVQVVAKGSDDYDAEFNWAFLKYQFNDQWSAKVGRQRSPLFMYSDFLDVGYAYHWITPPDSVYNLGGLDSTDGVSVTHDYYFGDWYSKATLLVGRIDTTVGVSGSEVNLEITNSALLAWSLNYDWFTIRASYSESEISLGSSDLDQLVGALELFGASEADINAITANDDKAVFAGLGFAIDYDNFLFVSEYTDIKLKDNFLAENADQWYASFGYRFSDYMVYTTYEKSDSDVSQDSVDARNNIIAGLTPLTGAPEPTGSTATQLIGGVTAAFTTPEVESETWSLGLRYNFHPAAAMKVEYLMQKYEEIGSPEQEPSAIAFAIDIIY